MVGQIYPTELKLSKVNSFDTESAILDTDFSMKNGIVSSKIYDNRNDFNLKKLFFPFLAGDVPRSPLLPMVYIVLREYVLMLVTSTTETYF